MKDAHISSGIRSILEWNFIYKTYQYMLGDHRIYKQAIQLCPDLKNKNVIDIGCGNGRLLDFIPLSANYKGYDFNRNYIEKARIKYKNRKAEFILADINNTYFTDQQADVVFLIGVIHHLNDQTSETLLENAKKMINERGVLVSIDPVFTEGQNRIAKYIISKDRGANIRTHKEYEQLSRKTFPTTKAVVYHDLINIPFSHIIQVSNND